MERKRSTLRQGTAVFICLTAQVLRGLSLRTQDHTISSMSETTAGKKEKKKLSGAERQAVYRDTKRYVTITLTPDEYQKLVAKAELLELPLATFVRQAALKRPNQQIPNKHKVPTDIRNLIAQLRAIGVNINQIAHHLNADQNLDAAKVAMPLAGFIEQIKSLIKSIKDDF